MAWLEDLGLGMSKENNKNWTKSCALLCSLEDIT